MVKKFMGMVLLLFLIYSVLPFAGACAEFLVVMEVVPVEEPPVLEEPGGDPFPEVTPDIPADHPQEPGSDTEPTPGGEDTQPPTVPVTPPLSVSTPYLTSDGGMGGIVQWAFQTTGADYIAYKVEYNGATYLQGTLPAAQTSFAMTISQYGQYVLSITAWRGAESQTVHSAAYQAYQTQGRDNGEPLAVAIQTASNSVFYGQTTTVFASVTGGVPPYSTQLTLTYGDTVVAQGQGSLTHTFLQSGQYVATVRVTDAAGASASETQTIPCAVNRTEAIGDIIPYVALTGNWAMDIVQVAQTQIGYTESTKNYIITEEGKQNGYTRYGDWYDYTYNNGAGSQALLYGDWCAMFVSFCADIAEIPTYALPRHTGTSSWAKVLREAGIFTTVDEHTPEKGDIVFIRNKSSQNGYVNHVGIVLEANSHTVTTIEGNVNKKVDVRTYDADSKQLQGYVSLSALQRLYTTTNTSHSGNVNTSSQAPQADLAKNTVVSVEVALAAASLANSILMGDTSNSQYVVTPVTTTSSRPPTRSVEFNQIVTEIIQLTLVVP